MLAHTLNHRRTRVTFGIEKSKRKEETKEEEEEEEDEVTKPEVKEVPTYVPDEQFALKPVNWLDPVERLLSDIAPYVPYLTATESIRPVWWTKLQVFIRKDTRPEMEVDQQRYDSETSLWQEALIPADEATYRMCCELSDTTDRMYHTLEQVRDYVVLYFGACYPKLREKPKVIFRQSLRYHFGSHYSNHFVYGVAQWTAWWAWRVWQQSVYTLSRLCLTNTFEWEYSELDARILAETYDLPMCIQQLHQSVCLLQHLQLHFLPRWSGSGVWTDVMSDEKHSQLDPLFIKTLAKANLALCQLLGLIDSEDYTPRWSIPEAEHAVHTTIRPYHEVFQHLHALENDIDARLVYLPQVGALALTLHFRALTRYALAYTDFSMGTWAWQRVTTDGTMSPQLANDLNSMTERRACYTAFTELGIPPFDLPLDWELRLQTPAIRATKDVPLSLLKTQLVPVHKFPRCLFRVQ